MPANASPEYVQAEKKFSEAQNDEERVIFLEEMIKYAPGHKGAESLRANLRTRYKKLKEKLETKTKRSSGGGKQGIKKGEMQACIIGFANTGKSYLFKNLTNLNKNISDVPFSTIIPEVGMMKFEDTQIQVIDMPPFPNEDKSTVNVTDTLLITFENLEQLEKSKEFADKKTAKKIYILTKTDKISENEKRKLEATIKSKYPSINYLTFSNISFSESEINSLKRKIFETFPISRVYTKEPKKEPSKFPMILKENSTTKDVAEKIIKGLSKKIKTIRIWGPSSKFPGQIVGLEHILKDKDTIEFKTE